MTEPVAYMWKTARGTITGLAPNDNSHSGGRLGIPLYTSEQLHPRVKMTQAEFDEFNSLYSQGLLFSEAMEMLGTQGELERYVNIRNRIYTQYLRENMDSEVIFAQLWQLYNPNNPEETIEIAPDMKWFVRSKEKTQGFYMFLGNLNELRDPWIFTKKDNDTSFAHKFDTKEEAEKWKNPLTEAVHLPVEGE